MGHYRVRGSILMKELFFTTVTGIAVGGVFSIFKLPIPAPPVFAGLMGIVGLWIGYALIQKAFA
jgi:XapX domain-containing protein